MDQARRLQLLDEQITAAANGYPDDFQGWRDQAEVVLRTVIGNDSPLYAKFQAIRYEPQGGMIGSDVSRHRRIGVRSAISIFDAAKKEIELRAEIERSVSTEETPSQRAAALERGRVFIVHGHDGAHKHELARLLASLTGTEPIILHEQANGGRLLLEKLEQTSANAGFAVILLTPDDVGRALAGSDQPRARQNVIFELGFFIASLGRQRVAVLVSEGVERPSDVDGLAYIPLDAAGGWKAKVANELETAGMSVHWQALSRG